MTIESIPDEVRRFILIQIPSIPYLEALLLLRGDRQGVWDRARVAHQLYLSETAAGALLDQLVTNSLAVAVPPDGGASVTPESALFQYQPATETLAATIDTLADVYSKNLVAVTHLIHAKPSGKAQRFADAFIWRKET
jgi:hypothetical protein